ncbi:MAG: uroporphyrinogen-III C-methyltransferase [Gemmatimonadales bacterium]
MKAGNERSPSALVLAAHGSRRDTGANAAIERRVRELESLALTEETLPAFHQGEPSFGDVLDRLSADRVVVVPFLTSEGHYTADVLPQALRRNRRFSDIEVKLTPPVGAHPGLPRLVARRVAELCRIHQLRRDDLSLALVGHGTPRHAASRRATLELAAALTRRRLAAEVLPAFLDDEPRLEDLVERTQYRQVLVIPFLIGGGRHARDDLPRRLGEPAGRRVIVDIPVGEYAELTGLVADLARRYLPAVKRPFRPLFCPVPRDGVVHLVGAGPGDPGLITVRGLALLREADVVLHDRLVDQTLVNEARTGAEVIDVGKLPGLEADAQERINALLVDRAGRGKRVVRLKGGDPFVFGRGSEEAAACREAGVTCRVVPGVSSAIAAPAAAGIPLTARGIASSAAVVTARTASAEGFDPVQAAALAALDTVVILMGHAALPHVVRSLIQAGRSPETAAACIQDGTTARQRVVRATLGTIAAAVEREGLTSPIVTVIGEVAALADVAPLVC